MNAYAPKPWVFTRELDYAIIKDANGENIIHIKDNRDAPDELYEGIVKSVNQHDKMFRALDKINKIRNSIVGMQGFNFSEHAYPLVAALNECGFEGDGYEISAKNFGTLLEKNKRLTSILEELVSEAISLSHIVESELGCGPEYQEEEAITKARAFLANAKEKP